MLDCFFFLVDMKQDVTEAAVVIIDLTLTLATDLTKMSLGKLRVDHSLDCFLTLFVKFTLMYLIKQGRVE